MPGGTSVAIDGKTLRGRFDQFRNRTVTQLLSGFATDTAPVLTHSDIAEKSNEISATPISHVSRRDRGWNRQEQRCVIVFEPAHAFADTTVRATPSPAAPATATGGAPPRPLCVSPTLPTPPTPRTAPPSLAWLALSVTKRVAGLGESTLRFVADF